MDDREIKPCGCWQSDAYEAGYCDEYPGIAVSVTLMTLKTAWRVQCPYCHAHTELYANREDAIAAWNETVETKEEE